MEPLTSETFEELERKQRCHFEVRELVAIQLSGIRYRLLTITLATDHDINSSCLTITMILKLNPAYLSLSKS